MPELISQNTIDTLCAFAGAVVLAAAVGAVGGALVPGITAAAGAGTAAAGAGVIMPVACVLDAIFGQRCPRELAVLITWGAALVGTVGLAALGNVVLQSTQSASASTGTAALAGLAGTGMVAAAVIVLVALSCGVCALRERAAQGAVQAGIEMNSMASRGGVPNAVAFAVGAVAPSRPDATPAAQNTL